MHPYTVTSFHSKRHKLELYLLLFVFTFDEYGRHDSIRLRALFYAHNTCYTCVFLLSLELEFNINSENGQSYKNNFLKVNKYTWPIVIDNTVKDIKTTNNIKMNVNETVI